MKIRLKVFHFGTVKDPGWPALLADMKARGMRVFDALGKTSELRDLDGTEWTVDPAHLFDNQFNTVPGPGSDKGRRLFDFRVLTMFNAHGNRMANRLGYYVEPGEGFEELQKLRAATWRCGYCGHQQHGRGETGWCGQCTGGKYLKPENLPLLELRPVADGLRHKSVLEPPAWLVKEYETRQRETAEHEARKAIADRLERIRKRQAAAAREERFTLAVVEAGATARDLDNLIYYDHTDAFCFGWHTALSPEDAGRLSEIVTKAGFDSSGVDFRRQRS